MNARKQKTKNPLLGILLIGLGVACCRYGMVAAAPIPDFITVYIGAEKFNVETAYTSEKQALGLMFRESIPDDFGMLFIYHDDDFRSYWMKNCKVALDIIFLDQDKQVINIFMAVPPCINEPCPSYVSGRPARYVLELRAFRSKELDIKPGDPVFFLLK